MITSFMNHNMIPSIHSAEQHTTEIFTEVYKYAMKEWQLVLMDPGKYKSTKMEQNYPSNRWIMTHIFSLSKFV